MCNVEVKVQFVVSDIYKFMITLCAFGSVLSEPEIIWLVLANLSILSFWQMLLLVVCLFCSIAACSP